MTLPYEHSYRFIPPAPDGTVPALWTPALIPTVAWFDADDSSTITHAGGVVSDWANKNGNTAYDLEQLTVGERPSLSTADADYNDRTVIDFANPTTPSNLVTDGVADTITFAASVGVFEYRDPWGAHSTRPTAYSGRSGGSDAYYAQFTDNDTDGVLDGFISGTHFLHGETTGVGGTSARAAELQDGPTLHTRKTAFTGNDGICVGADRTLANRSLNGKVAEIIFLPTDDLTVIQLVEGYLAWKWGTQAKLDPTHPYKFSPPLVGRTPKPWTPEQLNVQAWYDADAAYTIHEDTTAGRVSQWDDRGPKGNDIFAGVSTKEPSTGTRTLNGRNVLDFDPTSADQEMDNTGTMTPLDGGEFDIFAVFALDVITTGNRYLCTLNTTSGGQIRGNRFPDYSIGGAFDSGQGYGEVGQAGDTNPHIWNGRVGTKGAFLLLDGTQIYSDASDGGFVHIETYIRVGGNAFGSDGHDGIIGEFIVLPLLSDEDRYRVEGYLAWKWGLTANLPAAHPYKSYPPLIWE